MDTEEIQAIDRVERERSFYNQRGSDYDVVRRLIVRMLPGWGRYELRDRFYDPAGKHVLEYGSGANTHAPQFLMRGATRVTGIDISEQEIEAARQAAESAGVADRTHFMSADAHSTDFEDDSFDLIVGGSILHHLDLPVALAEIRRILRPNGRAVFSEPLHHNPILRLGRALTPWARTDDEHPITRDDWRTCEQFFPGFRHVETGLLDVPLMPLGLIAPRSLARLGPRLWKLDDRLLERYPRLRIYARLTFLILE